MAYAKSRSANAELHQGMIDSSYKLIDRDRGGDIGPATYAARRDLSDVWNGIHEVPAKTLPDGSGACITPTYQSNPPAQPSV